MYHNIQFMQYPKKEKRKKLFHKSVDHDKQPKQGVDQKPRNRYQPVMLIPAIGEQDHESTPASGDGGCGSSSRLQWSSERVTKRSRDRKERAWEMGLRKLRVELDCEDRCEKFIFAFFLISKILSKLTSYLMEYTYSYSPY